ncbi:UPF0182 family protein [Candidatus Uhrbacteria bacterium]|nr:UPF0182 family protein [Candidatus Uhrbacteria bacterium]
MNIQRFFLGAGIVIIALIVVSFSLVIALIGDWWWFEKLGFTDVFTTSLLAKIAVGVGVGAVASLFLGINIFIALHSRSSWQTTIPEQFFGYAFVVGDRLCKKIGFAASIMFGVFVGFAATSGWQEILKFLYAVPFGKVDPLFGYDISFYVFSLPIYTAIVSVVKFFILAAILGSGSIYFLRGGSNLVLHVANLLSKFGKRRQIVVDGGYSIYGKARLHLGMLFAFFLAAIGVGTFLSLHTIVVGQDGLVFGATAADAHILIPLLRASAITFGVAAVLMVLFAVNGKLIPLIGALFISLLISTATGFGPLVYQKLIVAPNELVKETPFIKHNISATRTAYNLENISERQIDAVQTLSAAHIAANTPTIRNVRLWDRAPLLSTFSQIQEIRTYYEFASVDNDRYLLDGELRQIVLSPRELSSDSLPNKSWINERLTFTHGYGVTAGPVNQATPEGLPVLFVKDLPPRSEKKELEVTRPEIYYGELANTYAVVKTKSKEFDYPQGEENVFTEYTGDGGIPLKSLFQKFVYAVRFQSLKFFLSGDITSESKLLMYRNITERAKQIAPFLMVDKDPYLVIADGRLIWILDAYTTTDKYPYSQPLMVNGERVNYIRNAVKITIDAYNGNVKFYLSDPADPIAQTYARIFPNMFQSLSDLPVSLKSHLRYPEDIFSAQTAMYTTYHMDDPQIFYNKEDLWEVPAYAQDTAQASSSMAPSHMIMKLPGEKKEEYILMLPFTPRAKDNLSAWMVARNDGEQYGEIVIYRFPKDKLIFGPKQIIGRINQDAEISGQISLWDQRGSQVIQGPLLVIPIEESLVYVRPLYLKAESGKIPELKRVIVAYENKIAMEETIEKGLAKIFGISNVVAGTSASDEKKQTKPNGIEPAEENNLQRAKSAYEAALQAQKSGDWAEYGTQIRILGDILKRLNK